MPDHLETLRKEVAQTDKASFFKLHNLAGDRCCHFQQNAVVPVTALDRHSDM